LALFDPFICLVAWIDGLMMLVMLCFLKMLDYACFSNDVFLKMLDYACFRDDRHGYGCFFVT
jgi:hypothetical protein